jgi:hypothetical protein
MEKIAEVWDSLMERLRHPLVVAFVISWVLWNWRFVVVMASDNSYSTKFSYVDEHYSADDLPWLRLVFGPVLSAVAYVIVAPTLALFTTWINGIAENRDKAIKDKLRRKRNMTVDERRQIEARLSLMVSETERKQAAFETNDLQRSTSIERKVARILDVTKSSLKLGLTQEADEWKDRRQFNNDSTMGSADRVFLIAHGLPDAWMRIFNTRDGSANVPITVPQAAVLSGLPEDEAYKALISLYAIGAVHFKWANDEPIFEPLPEFVDTQTRFWNISNPPGG